MLNANIDRSDAGFTLIEVLVAFVVSTILLVAIFAASSFAAARTRTAHEQMQAITVAQSTIERMSAASFVEGETQGREGPFIWTSSERALARDPRGLLILSHISVEVRNQSGIRLAGLDQRKLKRAVQ